MLVIVWGRKVWMWVETRVGLQVSKRLERTAGYFKRLGQLGFWGQLVCTVVAGVILAFSVVITGQATAPVSTYLTAGGIAAAFLSVFWSFGYIRLAKRLREAINDPAKAPPRAEVVKNLKNGIVINLIGLGSSLLGLQATVGVLVAKALTSSTTPYLQGAPQGFSPVLALDVFLVQVHQKHLFAFQIVWIHNLNLVMFLVPLRLVVLFCFTSELLTLAIKYTSCSNLSFFALFLLWSSSSFVLVCIVNLMLRFYTTVPYMMFAYFVHFVYRLLAMRCWRTFWG